VYGYKNTNLLTYKHNISVFVIVQIFRIAQELSSLAVSLPLNLSSAIFVRTVCIKSFVSVHVVIALKLHCTASPVDAACHWYEQVDYCFVHNEE